MLSPAKYPSDICLSSRQPFLERSILPELLLSSSLEGTLLSLKRDGDVDNTDLLFVVIDDKVWAEVPL